MITYYPFLLAVFALLIAWSLLAFQFRSLVQAKGGYLSFLNALYCVSITYSLNTILPFKSSSLFVKPFFTKRLSSNLSTGNVLGVVYFEYIYGFGWNLLLLFLVLVPLSNKLLFNDAGMKFHYLFLMIIPFLLVYLFIAYKVKLLFRTLGWLSHLPTFLKKRLKRRGLSLIKIEKICLDFSSLLRNYRLILQLLPISLLFVIFNTLAFILLLQSNNIFLPVSYVFVIYWAAILLDRFSFTGFLGFKDFGLAGGLALLGIPLTETIRFLILYKLLSLLPNFLMCSHYFLTNGLKLLRESLKASSLEVSVPEQEGLQEKE